MNIKTFVFIFANFPGNGGGGVCFLNQFLFSVIGPNGGGGGGSLYNRGTFLILR